jgi:hypothetical protein
MVHASHANTHTHTHTHTHRARGYLIMPPAFSRILHIFNLLFNQLHTCSQTCIYFQFIITKEKEIRQTNKQTNKPTNKPTNQQTNAHTRTESIKKCCCFVSGLFLQARVNKTDDNQPNLQINQPANHRALQICDTARAHTHTHTRTHARTHAHAHTRTHTHNLIPDLGNVCTFLLFQCTQGYT